ncbi:MAG: phosphatidylglycerol lysyltransferase domain-containing protein [Candidatus Zixiibacteriota bacterium]
MNESLTELIGNPRFSGGSLAFHALQPKMDIEWLNGAALPRADRYVIGEPLRPPGAPDSYPDPEDLRRRYPRLSFVHIGAGFARALKSAGYNIAALGSEALVDLPFSLAGAGKSDLRRSLNRSQKAGVTALEVPERDFPTITRKIERSNAEWLARRPLFRREFRFLARPYVRRFQEGERRFVAFQDGRAIGLAAYDPIIGDGAPVGYFEAIIRSFSPALPGVRDLLTLTALDKFASEGASRVSLGLCPFHPVPYNSDLLNSRLTDLALRLFYRYGGRVFNSRGLAFHKSRYRPRFETVYFATQSRLALIELYRICRLSNIDALYPVLRLNDSICGRLVRLFSPGHERLGPEQGVS